MTYITFPGLGGCVCDSKFCSICRSNHHWDVACLPQYVFPIPLSYPELPSFELQKLRQERDMLNRQLKESHEKRALIEEIEELKKKVKE